MAATEGPDPAMRLSDTEALLAVMVLHLASEIRTVRYALGAVMQHVPFGNQELWRFCHESMYPPREHGPAAAKPPPFPEHWLEHMATRGRSAAQAAGSTENARETLAQALGPRW